MFTTRKTAKLLSFWDKFGKIHMLPLGNYSLLFFNVNMFCCAIILICKWLWLVITHAVMLPFLYLPNWPY